MSRLATDLIVSALLRRTNDSGGFGAVLAKGDAQAGGMLVVIVSRDGETRVLERGIGAAGTIALIESFRGYGDDEYCRKRRRHDPDLWIVELDSPLAERFAAETLLTD